MRTVSDQAVREELISRISTINDKSERQWGKMTTYGMLKHCSMWEEMLLGKTQYKRSLLGRLFGRIALKDIMKDEPAKRNLPTLPEFVIKNDGDIEAEKAKWIALIQKHRDGADLAYEHPFFGAVTHEQAGKMAYKHSDHHLRQFGA